MIMIPPQTTTCEICKGTDDRNVYYTCDQCGKGFNAHEGCIDGHRNCKHCNNGAVKNWWEQNPGAMM